MNRTEELTLKLLDGSATSSEEQELAALTEQSQESVLDERRLLNLEADIRRAYSTPDTFAAGTRDRVMIEVHRLAEKNITANVLGAIHRTRKEQETAFNYGHWLALAASLAILIGGAVLLLDWQKEMSSIATLHSVTASVTVTHKSRTVTALEGMRLFAGDFVQASQPGGPRIEYKGEATTLILSKECCTRLDMVNGAKNVNLESGALACTAAKQPVGKPMRFITPQAEAVVIGTQLKLAVNNAATRLEVTEGSVQLVRNDQAAVMVNAGEFAVAAEGAELKAQSLSPIVPAPAKVSGPAVMATNHFALRPDGFTSDANFFPIGVWLQDPADAQAYKAAGVNVYVGLWQGPTEEDLSTLAAAGMKAICAQNKLGLKHLTDETIVGWLGCDGPDGVKFDEAGEYEPPLEASAVIQQYEDLKYKDPSRPVCITLGEGVALSDYPGRGSRANHPEDYGEYVKGGDVLNVHVYPVNDTVSAIREKLWYVPLAVDNLRAFSANAKPAWCTVECTENLTPPGSKPTPAQVRTEVWMALIHGANGIVYFCHSWPISSDSAALLHDATMLAAVGDINRQIASLAPVLNSWTIPNGTRTTSSNAAVPVDAMVKNHDGMTYVFAVAMRDGATTATFTTPSGGKVDVLGENRTLAISAGRFSDRFESYGVHLYKLQE